MVVPSSRRQPFWGPALVLVAVLLAPVFLVGTSAQQELIPTTPTPGWTLELKQGEGRIYNITLGASSTQVWFLGHSSDTMSVQTRVYNYGAQEAVKVPVYFWFSDADVPSGLPVGCAAVAVPAGQPSAAGVIPGVSKLAYWNISVPPSLPERGHNISIVVNQDPADFGGPALTRFDSSCPDQDHSTFPNRFDGASAKHRIYAYFVKLKKLDLQVAGTPGNPDIRWCMGDPSLVPSACDVSMMDNSRYPYVYNRTVHTQKPNPATGADEPAYVPNDDIHNVSFQVNIANLGSWANMTDYGSDCRCKGFPVSVRVLATGYGLGVNKSIAWSGAQANGTGWHTVGVMSLQGKAGLYQVNVTLDPPGPGTSSRGAHTESLPNGQTGDAETNNAAGRAFEVQHVDFEAAINSTGFRTDPADPYSYGSAFNIQGSVLFKNLGKAPLLHPESRTGVQADAEAEVSWRVHIPGTKFVRSGTIGPADDENLDAPGIQFSSLKVDIDFYADPRSGAESANHIRPGKHTLVAEIDRGDLSLEPNETNNVAQLDIYVQDANRPVVSFGPVVTEELDFDPIVLTRPMKPFAIRARATDDDMQNLNVTARFTLVGKPEVQRNYTLNRVLSNDDLFHVAVHNFTFNGTGSDQNWTYVLDVTDAFGNKADQGTPKPLRLQKWPIQWLPAADIVRQYPDNATFPYATEDAIAYQIKLWDNWTGVEDQRNYTDNLFMWIKPAGKETESNVSRDPQTNAGWQNLTYCRPAVEGRVGDITGTEYLCNTENPEFYDHFQYIVSPAFGKPGRWNISMRVMDVSGETRRIDQTLILTDAPPIPISTDVLAREGAAWRSVRSIEPGQPIWITANLSDDRSDPMAAYANFSRNDGRYANFTLTSGDAFNAPNAEGAQVPHFVFNTSVMAGQGQALGLGGAFNLTIAAKDSSGNWITTAPVAFEVKDTKAPALLDPKVTPSIQEVGQNFTFTARAVDESNVTAVLTIVSGDVDVVPPVELSPVNGAENFTYTTNLSVEGNYAWTLTVRDSLNRPTQHSGTLSIRDNLGPRFEIRSPSNVIGGERFATASPRIELVAFDSDSVDLGTLVLTVDGQRVAYQQSAAPPGVNGVTLTYQPGSQARRFSHGEEVTVNVSALDNSPKRLEGWLNFTFRVDDVAPAARLVSFDPKYRDAPSQDHNVSRETRFTLAADDNDTLPTDVAAIRYRVLAVGANSADALYTGPFRIDDLPGVYRGPTAYRIEYWAEDSAGNVNASRQSVRVYVDDAPPELIQYFPQGRYVNATLVDDRVGVQRAVVWHRVNAEPYRILELEPAAGNLWKGVLPEGRKGDRLSYYLQAWDRLNNTQTFGNASEPKASFAALNHDPFIRIVSPVSGSLVSGTFRLEWNASDEDGDALTYSVAYKAPGKTGYTEMAKLEASETRSYPVDSRSLLDGEYAFRVRASDGGVVKESEVNVRVLNRASAIEAVPPVAGSVVVGGTVLLKAQVTKAQATVEARLFLDGDFIVSFVMNDEGSDGDEVANDGVFSVRAPIDASGDYSVEIFTTYMEDGQTKEATLPNAVTFTARLTPGYVLREYAVVLVLIAVAAAAAIGLAAWAVARKRG